MPVAAAIAAPSIQYPSSATSARHLPLRFLNFASLASFPTPSHLCLWTRPSQRLREVKVFVRSDSSGWRTAATTPLSGGGSIEGSSVRDVPGQLGVDELLSVAEVLCVTPPIMYSIGCLFSFLVPGAFKQFQLSFGSKFFVVQYFLLVTAVAVGSLIRWRQWRRICRVNEHGMDVDLIGRIEKVEEDLRSSATIVRVLSRQLEKLGIRFRVTRKTLKEPIDETAALARKNSEVTRALAMQEDNLEKELGEIQKVLLAMQEQQQKQLDLILAIGKAARLLDSKRDSSLENGSFGSGSLHLETKKARELEIHAGDLKDV